MKWNGTYYIKKILDYTAEPYNTVYSHVPHEAKDFVALCGPPGLQPLVRGPVLVHKLFGTGPQRDTVKKMY